jgi:hypothetical protein
VALGLCHTIAVFKNDNYQAILSAPPTPFVTPPEPAPQVEEDMKPPSPILDLPVFEDSVVVVEAEPMVEEVQVCEPAPEPEPEPDDTEEIEEPM